MPAVSSWVSGGRLLWLGGAGANLVVVTTALIWIGEDVIGPAQLLKLNGRNIRRQCCGVRMQGLAATPECLPQGLRISFCGNTQPFVVAGARLHRMINLVIHRRESYGSDRCPTAAEPTPISGTS